MAEEWAGGLVPPLLIVIGIIGIIVPVLPGLLITLAGVFLWALITGTPTGWVVFGVCVLWFAAGVAGQFLIPGRRMRREGVGRSTLLIALLLGIIGFFVVPVIGAVIGFVGGIFLVESSRTGDRAHAWARTKSALRAVATSIGIELVAAFAIAATYAVGVLLHR